MKKNKKSGNFRYSMEEILESDFFKALGMERVKEFIIKGRPLTTEECQEVLIRTHKLFSSGKYKPDPDLERFLKGEGGHCGDFKSPAEEFKSFSERMKKRSAQREELRNKLLKKRELAGSEDSSPNDRGKKGQENKKNKKRRS